MTVLAESLQFAAQADGVEKFVVGAVVLSCGAVLVVRRSEFDDYLPGIEELPSGGVEAGEILAEALDRELFEEVGFRAGAIDDEFLEQFDYLSALGRLTRQFTVSVPLKDRAVRLSEEHIAARWITADDVIDTSCTPETQGVLESWFGR